MTVQVSACSCTFSVRHACKSWSAAWFLQRWASVPSTAISKGSWTLFWVAIVPPPVCHSADGTVLRVIAQSDSRRGERANHGVEGSRPAVRPVLCDWNDALLPTADDVLAGFSDCLRGEGAADTGQSAPRDGAN